MLEERRRLPCGTDMLSGWINLQYKRCDDGSDYYSAAIQCERLWNWLFVSKGATSKRDQIWNMERSRLCTVL